jgi:hypothetical protein
MRVLQLRKPIYSGDTSNPVVEALGCSGCANWPAPSPCSAWKKRSTYQPAADEMISHVFGATAHFERRLITERTKDGIAAAQAQGKLSA